MKRIYFLVLVAFIGMCAVGVLWAGADLLLFIGLPSLIFVLLPALLLPLGSFAPREIFRFFAISFRKEESSPAELKNGIAYFDALQRYLILDGIIGTFIGLITILANVMDPSLTAKGLAVALLTLLYAFVLTVAVVVPFRTGLNRRLNQLSG